MKNGVQMIKNLFFRSPLWLMFLACSLSSTIDLHGQNPQKSPQGVKPEQQFQLSDEELKALNLSESETEELRQFFSALNNLTPAQKQELEELGRATEERMKEQGLDPNNMDDLMKFMQNEGLTEQPAKKEKVEEPKRPSRPTPPQPVKKQIDKPEVLMVASSTDVKTMLQELLTHINSFRQKAITYPYMVQKLDAVQNEVAQLIFYLNVLRSPDLIKLLGSKDFVRLHATLEKLRKSFMTYEPSLLPRKATIAVNADNPYHVLDLPQNVPQEALEKRFQLLKSQQGPDAVEANAKAQGCEEKVCRRIRKSAERTFALMQSAYDQLKDPAKRTAVDSKLRQKAAQEQQQELSSTRTFDNLMQALTTAFSFDQILQQMNQLLEKHKPTELENMKAQVELEKKVYERSKRRVIIPQAAPSQRVSPSDQYESFYRSMNQRNNMPPGRRPDMMGRNNPPMPARPQPQQPNTGAMPQQGAPGKPSGSTGGKGSEKGSDKKSGDAKKGESSASPGRGKDAQNASKGSELSDDEIKSFAAIQKVSDLLEQAEKKEGKIDTTFTSRGKEIKESQNLSQIMKRLEEEFSIPDQTQAAEHLEQFFKEHKLTELTASMKAAVPGKGKALSGNAARLWTSQIADAAPMIQEWNQKVALPLTSADRQSGNILGVRGDIPALKKKQHGLDLPEIDPWKKAKKDEPALERNVAGVDLGLIRSQIKALHEYITTATPRGKQ